MTDPNASEHPAAAKTFDEIEADVKARGASGPDLATKLEGDAVPEDMRGKSLAEVLAQTGKYKEALKISEDARAELGGRVGQLEAHQAASEAVRAQIPTQFPSERPEPELTEEELQKLHEDEPLKAIQYVNARAEKRLAANIDARLSPLLEGNVSSAEARAKEKHKVVFELLGDKVQAFVDKLHDKNVMSSDKAWDDLIAYVSGQPENQDKLFKAQMDKALDEREADLQRREDDLAARMSGAEPVSEPEPMDDEAELGPNMRQPVGEGTSAREVSPFPRF